MPTAEQYKQIKKDKNEQQLRLINKLIELTMQVDDKLLGSPILKSLTSKQYELMMEKE